MKTRPKELTFLSLFLFAVAIGMPVQIMALYEHAPWEVGGILAKLAPLNWAIAGLALVAGWMVFRAHRWARYVVPVFGMLVVYNNWFVAEVGADYSKDIVRMGTGVFLLALSTILTRDVRDVLSHPERRWWLTPFRRKAQLPIRVCFFKKRGEETISSSEFYAKTFDISRGGAFVNLDDDDLALMTDDMLKNLDMGTQCFVCITLKELSFLQCRAEIVRRASGSSRYPSGIGLRFVGLSWQDERMLKDFMKRDESLMPKPGKASQVKVAA